MKQENKSKLLLGGGAIGTLEEKNISLQSAKELLDLSKLKDIEKIKQGWRFMYKKISNTRKLVSPENFKKALKDGFNFTKL